MPFVLHYVLSQSSKASFTNWPLLCQGASAEEEDTVQLGFEVQPTEEENILLLGFHCVLQPFQVQKYSACELFFQYYIYFTNLDWSQSQTLDPTEIPLCH